MTAAVRTRPRPGRAVADMHLPGDTPAAMSAEDAATVRATAWTAGMRKAYRDTPRYYTTCACQSGPTWHCSHGPHGRCHRDTPLRSTEAYIVTHTGGVAHLPEEYLHPTDTSATGPSRTSLAQVWHADRVCRWVCRCDCHTPGPAAPAPAPAPAMSGGWEQTSLL